MTIPILCLIVLFFLGWVILLRTEIQGLKETNRKLADKVKTHTALLTSGVEAGEGRRLTKSEIEFAARKSSQNRSGK
jgi:hypothetical protein